MTLQSMMHVRMGRDGVLSRRTFLTAAGASVAGLGLLGWKETVMAQASQLRKQGMACILLFMRGGPSQFETFSPKPGVTNGGPTTAIDTAVSGIKVAEGWSKIAAHMKDIALIRSMTSKEGEHLRATYQMHTGYVPSGSVKHPGMGAIVAKEIGQKDFDLPNFVSIGGRFAAAGSGFLGMKYAPFVVGNPDRMPGNVELPAQVDPARFNKRVDLLKDLESDFADAGGGPRVKSHQALYSNASRMVLSPRLKAFDLSQEPAAVHDRYGKSNFGAGCLLARRLVEAGVTFVEVELNGWDTHDDNFKRVATLAGTCDPAYAALLAELKERGMLDKTLVIWTGEFGRTPRINPRTGRDHYPRAFNAALAGGGVKGGQVIGATTADGTTVNQNPVTVNDFFCSLYHSLKINPHKENMSPLGRPMKLVEAGDPVKQLF